MATEPDYRHMTSGRITGTDEEDTEDQAEEEAWDESGAGAGKAGGRPGRGRPGRGRPGRHGVSREDRLTRRRYRDDSQEGCWL
jgi:hypothetical protein